ncbi:hypothetical protein FEP76_05197 [Burkholderia multivorans]|nr:hypothetical protein [Burkholderia multivorans]
MPASPFARATYQRDHRAECGQVSGRMIERLAGQMARRVRVRGLLLAPRDAARRLHETVEAAPCGPRARMPVRRHRYADDAGTRRRQRLRSEAACGERTRTICLQEDVGVAHERAQRVDARRLAQIEPRGALAATVVDHERRDVRQVRPVHEQSLRAVRSERAPRDRPRDDARQIEHAYAVERARGGAAADRLRRRVADPFDLEQRQRRDRAGLFVRGPLVRHSDQRRAQPGVGQRGIERGAVPGADRRGDIGGPFAAIEHVEDAVQMMRKVRMQLNPATVARRVEARDRVAQLGRRSVVDAQIAFAAKRDERVAHRHVDTLRDAGTQPMAFGRREAGRCDRCGRERTDAKRRGQDRIVSGHGRSRQRVGVAVRALPQMGQCLFGSHGGSPSLRRRNRV